MAKRKRAGITIDHEVDANNQLVGKLRDGWDILTNLSEKPSKRTVVAAQKFMDATYKWLGKAEDPTAAELFRTAPIQALRPSNLIETAGDNGPTLAVWQLLYSRLMYIRAVVHGRWL